MSLDAEDKRDIERMLKPLGEAAKSQAASIEKQTGHMGKMSERMARVEEKVEAVQGGMRIQMKQCHEIHQDLYAKVNPLPERIMGVGSIANEANERSKWLRYVIVGLLILVAIMGIEVAWDVISTLMASQ